MKYTKLHPTELNAKEDEWQNEFEPLRRGSRKHFIKTVVVPCLITLLLFVIFLGLFQPIILPLLESTFRNGRYPMTASRLFILTIFVFRDKFELFL
jgi:hypothetical protein